MLTDEQAKLLNFLRGDISDDNGRYIYNILAFSRHQLEVTHNYIQWLFPIDSESSYAYSIILTEELAEEIKKDSVAMRNVELAYKCMLEFYGFRWDRKKNKVVKYNSEIWMRLKWLNKGNHNFLRLTRIIRCLTLLGMHTEATELLTALTILSRKYKCMRDSLKYWRNARLVVKDGEECGNVEERSDDFYL